MTTKDLTQFVFPDLTKPKRSRIMRKKDLEQICAGHALIATRKLMQAIGQEELYNLPVGMMMAPDGSGRYFPADFDAAKDSTNWRR